MKLRCVVHIGPTKTGTTALAKHFTLSQRAGKLPNHLIYPIDENWPLNQGAGAAQKHHFEALEPAGFEAAVEKLSRSLRADDRGDEVTVVFVSETATLIREPSRFQDLFCRHFDEVIFVLSARRQDKAAASRISQEIKEFRHHLSGLNPRMRRQVFGMPFGEYNHFRNFQRWSVGPKNYKLQVIPYLEEEHGTYKAIERFYKAGDIGQPIELDQVIGTRIHPTFSKEGLVKLGEIKRKSRRWRVLRPIFRIQQTRFKLEYEKQLSIASFASREEFIPWELSKEDSIWLLEKFEASNRELLRHLHDRTFYDEWRLWEQSIRDILNR
jgi:hypothetical protein